MRCKSLVLALTVGMGGLASAQPGPPPQPPPPPVDTTTTTTTTTTDTNPVVVTPAPTQPIVATPTPAPQPVAESAGPRPEGMAIGLGVGYSARPMSLQTPNITSLRLRLAGGLTFEPLLEVSNETETAEAAGVEATNKDTTFQVAALGRLPLISRGKADLEGLASLGFRNNKNNPEGDFNTVTTNTFALGWGVAVGYWFSPHFQLSFNITNPLIVFSSQKTQAGPGMTTKDSTTAIGLIFDPGVFMRLHLYT
jgi:hypothetical protein